MSCCSGLVQPQQPSAATSATLGEAGVTLRATTTQCFPYVWLRDNCQCPECFHPVSQGRLLLLNDLDVEVTAAEVTLSQGGEKVRLDDSGLEISPKVPLAFSLFCC